LVISNPMLSLDLRPLLAAGTDPLQGVVEQAGRLPSGARLELEAPFNPLPLRRVLGQMGFSSKAEKLADGHWRISLERDGAGEVVNSPSPEDCRGLTPGAPTWQDGQGLHMDVRGLPMPLPMLAILRLVGSLEGDQTLLVHHDREPVFLIPELAEIGWSLEPQSKGAAGELIFLVRRG